LLPILVLVGLIPHVAQADAESFELPSDIHFFTDEEIRNLPAGITYEALQAQFGPPIYPRHRMIAWPKKATRSDASAMEKWRRGYWFFFDVDRHGLKKPLTVAYVASVRQEASIDPNIALFDLLPFMTIDWPMDKRGRSFTETFERDMQQRHGEAQKQP
jgi:hypothetical protein